MRSPAKDVERKPMPDWVEPMLARLTHHYFSGEQWIFERKLDGEHVMAYIDPGGACG